MTEPLEIVAQGTPNPNAVKFTLNRVVATQGTTYRLPAPPQNAGAAPACRTTDVAAGRQAGDAAWATELLRIPDVTQVFAINNFISVTKTPDADWNVIGPQIEAIVRRAFV